MYLGKAIKRKQVVPLRNTISDSKETPETGKFRVPSAATPPLGTEASDSIASSASISCITPAKRGKPNKLLQLLGISH